MRRVQSRFVLYPRARREIALRGSGGRASGRAGRKRAKKDEKRGHYKNLFMTARVLADAVISRAQVISEASCRLTGVSEIFPACARRCERPLLRPPLSPSLALKQRPLDISGADFRTFIAGLSTLPRRLRY